LTLLAEIFAHTKPEEEARRKLFIVISSDRGLCGGIHSSVSKATRKILGNTKATPDELEKLPKAAPDSPVMVIGDKSKAQLSRAVPKNIALSFNQIGKDVPTFADACAVADLVTTSGVDYDSVCIANDSYLQLADLALPLGCDCIQQIHVRDIL
jgi:F-type H+-transporting ATPase subunit gamma